jgi:hypothetical protein
VAPTTAAAAAATAVGDCSAVALSRAADGAGRENYRGGRHRVCVHRNEEALVHAQALDCAGWAADLNLFLYFATLSFTIQSSFFLAFVFR